MGKKVIIPSHPSNVFFAQFSNTIMYDLHDPHDLAALRLHAHEMQLSQNEPHLSHK